MSFSGVLADLFVQFSMKGLDVVNQAIEGLKPKLEGLKKGVDAVASAAKPAFIALSGSLTGWITAGIAGTAVADQLSFRMQQLARNIAGLFYPELEKLINLVQKAVDWFRSLSDEQRESIAHWTIFTTVALGVATILPKIIAGMQSVAEAMQAINVALAIGNVLTGEILPVIGAVAAALLGLGAGAIIAEGGFGELLASLKPLVTELTNVAKTVLSALAPLLDIAKTVIATLVTILTPIAKLLGAIVSAVAAVLKPVLEIFARIVHAIGAFISSVVDVLSPLFDAIGEVAKSIGNVLGAALSLLKPILEALLTLLKPIVQIFLKIGEIVVNVVVEALKALAAILQTVADALNWLSGTEQKASKVAKDAASASRGELLPRSSGFTSGNEAFRRIAQQSVAVGQIKRDPIEVAQQQLEEQKGTNQRLDRLQTPFARS